MLCAMCYLLLFFRDGSITLIWEVFVLTRNGQLKPYSHVPCQMTGIPHPVTLAFSLAHFEAQCQIPRVHLSRSSGPSRPQIPPTTHNHRALPLRCRFFSCNNPLPVLFKMNTHKRKASHQLTRNSVANTEVASLRPIIQCASSANTSPRLW